MDARTPDAPYGETFSVREVWLAHAASAEAAEHQIVFQRLMKLEFVKYTIFKSRIEQEAKKGCVAHSLHWFALAEKGGHFIKHESVISHESVSNIYGDETRRPLLFVPSETTNNRHGRNNLNSLDVSGILGRMTPPI